MLDLAEDRHHRHQDPGPAQRREHGEVAVRVGRVAGQGQERRPQVGVGPAEVTGEGGPGEAPAARGAGHWTLGHAGDRAMLEG